MAIRKLLVVFVICTFFITACQPQTPAPTQTDPLSAGITGLEGGVQVKPAEAVDFTAAQLGMTLTANGTVRTESDGRARLDLSSGTIVRVAPSSVFTLISNEVQPDQSLATKIKLELGQIFIVLTGGSAEVETPSGQASVRGSYMMVKIDPVTKTVKVTCLEGDCYAKTSKGGVSFAAGQVVVLTFGDFPPELGEMSQDDFQEWLSNVPESVNILSIATATIAARATATPTSPSTPMETPTPTATPTETSTPTATPQLCSTLLTPVNGATLKSAGKEFFTWTEFPGAVNYKVVINWPNNNSKSVFNLTKPAMTLYIEALPLGGDYNWLVEPQDANGNPLCQSEAFTFNKPETPPTATNTPAPVVIHNTSFNLISVTGACNGFTFVLDVVDPDGVNPSTVYVFYRLNNEPFTSVLMAPDGYFYGSGLFTNALGGVDVVSYYFQATDLSSDTTTGGNGSFICPPY